MKISNISPIKYNFDNSNIHKYSSKPELNENKNKKGSEVYFSGEYYRSLLNINNNKKNVSSNNITFGNLYHKTISSKIPVYRPCCSTYDDIDEFSRQFCEKINSQIQNPSIEDVERLIENVKKETGADERLVKEVIFRLSQFSSFKSLSFIDNELKKKQEHPTSNVSIQSLANSIAYLSKKFGYNRTNGSTVSFLDDFVLQGTKEYSKAVKENFKNELPADISKFCNYFGKKAYVLDGFDVLTSEGKYCGANFMSGTGYLEDLSIDVIKQIQNGKDIEDIMHGDLEKRFKKQFPKEIFYKNSNFAVETIKKPIPKDLSAKNIWFNLQEKTIDSYVVKRIIEEYAEQYSKIFNKDGKINTDGAELMDKLFEYRNTYESIYIIEKAIKYWQRKFKTDNIALDKQDIKRAIMKYLDAFAVTFSAHSASGILNQLGIEFDKIEKTSGKENIIAIPDVNKSYSLLTYMFMKNNLIDYNKAQETSRELYNDENNFVIIDDSSISGTSQAYAIRMNQRMREILDNGNVYYAPVVLFQTALDKMKTINYENTIPSIISEDILHTKTLSENKDIKPDKKIDGTNLTYLDLCILDIMMEKKYLECGSAVSFPYILPDTNSDIASDIFTPLLIEVTRESRKN